ncbi:hypothetical protein NDU88_004030 [Pleurodeles waltl]|uniref:Uncharacterized protein n=1 Tax=Pleurodeles waltl TaxID=8319 RepID=A0AAV7MCU9_PLEWA|nr:hypothetical protein NDU88_004030 [Pleurodeles waltl]
MPVRAPLPSPGKLTTGLPGGRPEASLRVRMLQRARGGLSRAERRETPLPRREVWSARYVLWAAERLWWLPRPRRGPLFGGCLGPAAEGPEVRGARVWPRGLCDHRGGLYPMISRRPAGVGHLAGRICLGAGAGAGPPLTAGFSQDCREAWRRRQRRGGPPFYPEVAALTSREQK